MTEGPRGTKGGPTDNQNKLAELKFIKRNSEERGGGAGAINSKICYSFESFQVIPKI